MHATKNLSSIYIPGFTVEQWGGTRNGYFGRRDSTIERGTSQWQCVSMCKGVPYGISSQLFFARCHVRCCWHVYNPEPLSIKGNRRLRDDVQSRIRRHFRQFLDRHIAGRSLCKWRCRSWRKRRRYVVVMVTYDNMKIRIFELRVY